MHTSLKRPCVSLEDYFALDQEGGERCEYRNGEVLCMGGAQPEHNAICLNLGGELRSRLRGSGCRPFPSDQRVKVNTGGPYLYPDLSVACEPRFTTLNGLRTLINPILIVEVTSPSSAQDDRGATFLQYQTIETLSDYLLVDSTAIGILHFHNLKGLWQPRLIESLDTTLQLPRLGIELPVAEIYLDSGVGPA